jgi:predicted alpha-1,6-mannanase (GH76 family)
MKLRDGNKLKLIIDKLKLIAYRMRAKIDGILLIKSDYTYERGIVDIG